MAIATRVEGMVMKRMRLFVDGLAIGSVRSGLDFEPATTEIVEAVYGNVSGVNMTTYESGPQSIEVLEDPNSTLVAEMFAGIPDRTPTRPTLVRHSSAITQRVAVVEVLNANHNGYGKGSTVLLHWSAVLGTARNDPSGIAIRTVSGSADAPVSITQGGVWLCKRVELTSDGSGWTGTWDSPLPLAFEQKSGVYAIFLEIQSGSGFDRVTKEITVDATNVIVDGTGGQVLVTHADVIDAGFLTAGITHAWVVFAHENATLQDHDYRWGTT